MGLGIGRGRGEGGGEGEGKSEKNNVFDLLLQILGKFPQILVITINSLTPFAGSNFLIRFTNF